MLSFDEFEAEIPKGTDFRPQLLKVIRRYGQNHREAREHFRGSDGYVYYSALLQTQGTKRPVRLRSDNVDLSIEDPHEYYRKKASDLKHSDPSKRGSRRTAIAICYWFFRYVDDVSYFREIAPYIWPTGSNTFKRFIYAKCGGAERSDFSSISARFRQPLDVVEDGLHESWFEVYVISTADMIQKARLEGAGRTETSNSTPNLGLHFLQGGRSVTVYRYYSKRGEPHEGESVTTLVPLKSDRFSISRRTSTKVNDEVPNLFFSIQTHRKAHDEIERSINLYTAPGAAQSFEGVKLSIGDGIADHSFGSTTYCLDDNVSVRQTPYGSSTVNVVDLVWNIVLGDRFHRVTERTHEIDVYNIVRRKTLDQCIGELNVMYFTFLDAYNDELLGRPKNLSATDRTMFNNLKIDRVVLIFH